MMRTVQLPEKMAKRLSDVAAKQHCSELACVEEALEQFFLDIESEEKACAIALERLEKGGRTISLEEVRRQFDLPNDD